MGGVAGKAAARLMLRPLADAGSIEVFVSDEPAAEFAPHWHEQWSVGAIQVGCCRFHCQGLPYLAAAGDVVVIPPLAVHAAGVSVDAFSMVMVYLPPGWVAERLGWPQPGHPAVLRAVNSDPALAAALSGAARCAEVSAEALAEVGLRAIEAATAGGAWCAGAPVADERIVQLCHLLRSEVSPPVTPSALAEELGVSREHLHRLFRTSVGVSPGQYLRMARMAAAKRLLAQGAPIADVAAACGFADQPHFTRWFRRTFGVSPKAYRVDEVGNRQAA